MNRRSFLLGLATVPVVGIVAITAMPTVVTGIDGGCPDVCCAYVLVHEEVHTFLRDSPRARELVKENRRLVKTLSEFGLRPDVFVKIQTTAGRGA